MHKNMKAFLWPFECILNRSPIVAPGNNRPFLEISRKEYLKLREKEINGHFRNF